MFLNYIINIPCSLNAIMLVLQSSPKLYSNIGKSFVAAFKIREEEIKIIAPGA